MSSSSRRRILVLATLTGLALTASPALAGPESSSRWSQSGFDSGRSNWNPNERTLDVANVSDLGVAWVRDSARATPVFRHGRGYAGGGVFDPEDGSDLARLAAAAGDNSSPALVGGRVVVSSWDDTSLSAMDAATGKMSWDKPYADAGSSPTVARGTIFSSVGGVLRAIDPAAGSVDWKTRVATRDSSDPVVSRGVVLVRVPFDGSGDSSATQKVVALDAASGDIVWKRKAAYYSTDTGDSLAASDGLVLTATGNVLTALDVENGSTLWKADTICCDHTPAIADGVVYTTEPNFEDGGTLHAVDAKTGETIWSKDGTGFSDGVSVANGVVYQATMGLQAFDASNGELLLDLDIGFTWHAPVIVNGTVYLAIENGPHTPPATGEGLYAFRLP